MKQSRLLAIWVVFLLLLGLTGTAYATSTDIYVPRKLRVELGGKNYNNGDLYNATIGARVTADIFAADSDGDGILSSADFSLKGSFTSAEITKLDAKLITSADTMVPLNLGAPVLFGFDPLGKIPAVNKSLGEISFAVGARDLNKERLTFSLTYNGAPSNTSVPIDVNVTLLVTTASTPIDPEYAYGFPLPRQIFFTDKDPNNYPVSRLSPVNSITLDARETKELYVAVADINRNGEIDWGDYYVWGGVQYVITTPSDGAIARIYPSTMELDPVVVDLSSGAIVPPVPPAPARVTKVQIQAVQPTGDEVDVEEEILDYSLKINDDGVPVKAAVAVTVRPVDDGKGSCSTVGLGALLLLPVLLAIYKKRDS